MDFSKISKPGNSSNPEFIPQIVKTLPNGKQYMPYQIYDNLTKAMNKYVGKFEIIPVTAIVYVDQFLQVCSCTFISYYHIKDSSVTSWSVLK